MEAVCATACGERLREGFREPEETKHLPTSDCVYRLFELHRAFEFECLFCRHGILVFGCLNWWDRQRIPRYRFEFKSGEQQALGCSSSRLIGREEALSRS